MFWFLSGNHHWPFTKLLKGFVCTPTVSFGVNLLSQHKLLGEWCEQAGQWQVHGSCSGNSAEANDEHLMGGKVFSASAISKAFSGCVLMGNFDSSHFWIHKSHSFFRSIWSLGLFFLCVGVVERVFLVFLFLEVYLEYLYLFQGCRSFFLYIPRGLFSLSAKCLRKLRKFGNFKGEMPETSCHFAHFNLWHYEEFQGLVFWKCLPCEVASRVR